MFKRYRMKKCIKLLEAKSTQNLLSLLYNPRYLKAFHALEANDYVRGFYADNEDIPYHALLGKKGPVYLLERSELWINRLAGFITGVLSSVIVALLLDII